MEGIFGTREEELPKFKDYFLNSMKTLNSTMDKSKVDATGKFEPYLKGAVPILVGLFLPSLAGSSKAIRGIANGMIASGASTVVGSLLKTAGVPVGNVMMGNVMMGNSYGYGGTDSSDLGNDTFMGAPAQGSDDFTSTSYDFTNADAGEMDY